jgi:CDP-diacylglycerol pyrophosphatase
MTKPMSRAHRVFLSLFAACAVLATSAAAADRGALWRIAHDQCVPNEEAHQNPAPCAHVDVRGGIDRGYVILKDRVGIAQFLLIPTRRIAGIESPDLLAPGSFNYWAAAWQNRTYVMAAIKHDLAWDTIGLAVNSALSRSQDEFHIHIDCLAPEVRALLAVHRTEIGTTWAELAFDLRGERYFARRLAAADLPRQDPLTLLASGVPGAGQHMGQETLVVAGVTFAPGQNGFVLLAARANPASGNLAHGENLLDHSCALATLN